MTWYYVPYTSVVDTEDSSLPCEESPAPWLTLSGTPTQRPLSWRGWMNRAWIKRLSGLTCAPSTLARGVDAWTSSLPVSPASHSVPPASGAELTMTVGSGPTLRGSLVKFDPATCSWRTCHSLFDMDSPMSSLTLPPSGSMRNGACTPRPTLVRRTAVNGSGSWPTAVAMNSEQRALNPEGRTSTLVDAVKRWPSPRANDAIGGHETLEMRPRRKLKSVAADWATTDSHHAPTTPLGGPSGLHRADLNPRFVAALMGLPPDWLTPSTWAVTDSCPNAPEKPGANSQHDSTKDGK